MKSVLFVCLGNICRSPIAEGIAKKIAEDRSLHVKISSCGTGDWHAGEHPCQRSIDICRKHDVDISKYISSQITKQELSEYELIIALDQNNYDDLQSLGAKNLKKLGSFGLDGIDVPDPYYYKSSDGFDEVYKMIEKCVVTLFES
jgi:protein-tyrosine phosphatase